MAKWIVSGWVALAVLAASAVGSVGPVALDKAVEYPHAGVALATPKGFLHRPLSNPYDVVDAVIMDSGRPVQAVTLSAFPVASEMTAEEFAETKMAELKKQLAIRKLKLLKKTPMPVAGLNGSARLMSYTFRGARTIAAQVYFIREVKKPEIRICYLLTVVCSAERQPQLLPTLGAVVRSVRMVALRHPAISAPGELGAPIVDFELGYSLKQPRSWYAGQSAVGADMGIVDYLLGGVAIPSVQLLTRRATEEEKTPQACAKAALSVARSVAAQRKQACEVVSQGPATLGELEAYQFVLMQSNKKDPAVPTGAKPAEAVVIVQRTACLTQEGRPLPKVFMLTLTVRGTDTKAAEALMATIAGGFAVVKPPTTQPTTAPSTQPATQPTTRPAARPTTRPAAATRTPPARTPAATPRT